MPDPHLASADCSMGALDSTSIDGISFLQSSQSRRTVGPAVTDGTPGNRLNPAAAAPQFKINSLPLPWLG